MIRIEQAIVVEGKYDKIKLSSLVDAVIIVTNGFGVFRDRGTMELIRRYAKTTGIIILTDSDRAGFAIRNHIKGCIQDGKIIHVYIPDIFGKERRKIQPSKEGKLGVEGIGRKVLLEAFQKAGVICTESSDTDKGRSAERSEITMQDFYERGLTGGAESVQRRDCLRRCLNLPGRLTTKGLLELLNVAMTQEDFYRLAEKLWPDSGDFPERKETVFSDSGGENAGAGDSCHKQGGA